MQNVKDELIPQEKWAFDEAVTHAFDDMLRRSIPQYEVMRRACFDIACEYIKLQTSVIDIGCSRGEALAMLVDQYGARNHFIGTDISEPMLAEARQRFSGYISCGIVDIRNCDLRLSFPFVGASVIQSILTLQFTPIEYRQRIVRDIYKALNPGGAFILVEKVLGATAELDALMVKTYYGIKVNNGYTQEQIERKRLSLEGVLVPVTARWNEELLQSAGFSQVDCFWRWMNFGAWVAVKE